MRSDEYSEWDEYIGLEAMKHIVENAITEIAATSYAIQSKPTEGDKPLPECGVRRWNEETLTRQGEILDVVRASLCALRNQLSQCTMVGTKIMANGESIIKEETREEQS